MSKQKKTNAVIEKKLINCFKNSKMKFFYFCEKKFNFKQNDIFYYR